jgi:hypothetical protein
MTLVSRVRSSVTRAVMVGTGFFVVLLAAGMTAGQQTAPHATAGPGAASADARPKVSAQALALQDFQTRLKAYLTLRDELSRKLKPLSSTPSATELTSRQESLAGAMKMARAKAKRGDLVPTLVAEQIATTISEDFRRRNPVATKGTLKEVPVAPVPVVNKVYPPGDAMPTVPPLLLKNLPQLPDNLQYRFFGRSIVILDGDLQLIADVIPGVLPPH